MNTSSKNASVHGCSHRYCDVSVSQYNKWLEAGTWAHCWSRPLGTGASSDPLVDGHYIYTRDLRSLAGMCQPHPRELLRCMTVVRTPKHVDVWKELTGGHPDREYVVEYISKGLQEGLKIGFNY